MAVDACEFTCQDCGACVRCDNCGKRFEQPRGTVIIGAGEFRADTEMRLQLARDVLRMAALGGMPDTYWFTDSRIERAAKVLDWTPEKCREWARSENA